MLPIPGTSKVSRSDLEFEIVDLRDFPLPFFNEVASNLWAPTQNEVAAASLELSDEDFRALDKVGQEESERQQKPRKAKAA